MIGLDFRKQNMSFFGNLFSSKGKVKDPVCGMMVDPEKAEWKSDYQGKTYFFCSENCQKQFEADPAQFLK